MKYLNVISILAAILFLTSCSHQKKMSSTNIYVNSYKDDKGNYLISEDEITIGKEWTVYEGELTDFDFKTGEISILEVKKENDSLYKTISIVERYIDKNAKINDIWLLETLENDTISNSKLIKKPTLQFSISTNKVYGNDGCNNISGLFLYDQNRNIKIDKLMGTKMLCENMEISDKFNLLLPKVNHYSISNNILTLYDIQNNELMRLKKID